MSVQKLFDLTGRVALITGGSRGLGLQIAEAYAEQGAKLVYHREKGRAVGRSRRSVARAGRRRFSALY